MASTKNRFTVTGNRLDVESPKGVKLCLVAVWAYDPIKDRVQRTGEKIHLWLPTAEAAKGNMVVQGYGNIKDYKRAEQSAFSGYLHVMRRAERYQVLRVEESPAWQPTSA